MKIISIPSTSHEDIRRVEDAATGLIGFIAIHSTTLGSAAGGLRMKPYASEQEALTDVMRLSEGMTYKNAAAGLPLGGGKAVILGDPKVLKTPELLHAFARAIEACEGRYWTAEDMGMTPADMAELARETRFVAGAGGWGICIRRSLAHHCTWDFQRDPLCGQAPLWQRDADRQNRVGAGLGQCGLEPV